MGVGFEPRDGVAEEWLVQKMHDDVFDSNSDLAAKLKASGVESIFALGIMSEYAQEILTLWAPGTAAEILASRVVPGDDLGLSSTPCSFGHPTGLTEGDILIAVPRLQERASTV